VDQSLDLLALGQQMKSVTAGHIKFQTIPTLGTGRSPEGRSIVRLADAATVHSFFANLSADPKPSQGATTAAPRTVAPGQVKVAVLNGSGTPGLAAKTAADLQSAGFVVTSTGNADSNGYANSEIRYAAGDDALANTLAGSIPGATTKQVTGVTAGTVQLVLGKNFAGVGAKGNADLMGSPALAPAAATTDAGSTGGADSGDGARTAADTSCIN
jgi:hypothetical protein